VPGAYITRTTWPFQTPPNARHLTTSISQVNKDNLNPLKRKKPNNMPDFSPTASGINNPTASDEIDVKEDMQGRKYIEVVCGGRSGYLILDKFHKQQRV